MKEYLLKDICQVVNGRAYSQSELLSCGKYPVLRVGNFFSSDRWYYSNLDLSPDKYCENGDLLFAWSASFGPKIWNGKKVVYHYHIWKLIEDDKIVDKYYLYYWLKFSVNKLTAGTHGSVMAHMTKADMENQQIILPELSIQKKIGCLLKLIDSKIDVNNAINNNLQQQFSILYQQYFADNRSQDWAFVPLEKIIYFQEGPGIRNWQYVTENGTKFINIRCIENGDINTQTANMISNDEANGKYAHFMLRPFDIVMSCSGTLGRYAIVRPSHLPLCLNTSVIRFSPKVESSDFSYIYGYLTSQEFLTRQSEMACGSVQSNFGPTHLKRMFVCDVPIYLRREFHKFAFPLVVKMLSLRDENEKLISLRNILLPKLMNGEIDVSEIEI